MAALHRGRPPEPPVSNGGPPNVGVWTFLFLFKPISKKSKAPRTFETNEGCFNSLFSSLIILVFLHIKCPSWVLARPQAWLVSARPCRLPPTNTWRYTNVFSDTFLQCTAWPLIAPVVGYLRYVMSSGSDDYCHRNVSLYLSSPS